MGALNFFVNEKAVLEILDLREIDEVSKKNPPNADGLPSTSLTMADLSKMEEIASSVGDFATQSDVLEQTILGNSLQNVSGLNVHNSKKQFQVQFNPSDLQIAGHGGGRMATTSFNNSNSKDKNGSGSIDFIPVPIYISLNVKLLFDRMDPNDCFLSAKTNVAPSEMGKSLIKTGLNAFGKNKKMTVQQEVEGLFMFLGINGGRGGEPLHSSRFDFDEDVLLTGTEIFKRILECEDYA